MKVIKQYSWIIKKSWKEARWLHMLYMCVMLISLTMPTLVSYGQKAFIAEIEDRVSIGLVVLVLGLYVFAKFMNSVFKYIDSFFAHKFIFRMKLIFSNAFNQKLYAEPQEHFYNPEFQDGLKRISTGMELIPFQCFSVIELGLSVLVLFCVQLPIVFTYSSLFLLYFVMDSLFSLLTSRKIVKARYENEQQLTREQRKADYLGSVFTEKSNAKELRIFGAQLFVLKKWSESFQNLNNAKSRMEIKIQKEQMFGAMVSFLMEGGLLLFLFFCLLNGKIKLASFAFLYTFIPAVSEQIKSLLQTSLGDMYENYLNIEHYVRYIDGEPSKDADGDKEQIRFEFLEAENISYKYPAKETCAVKNVSFSIKKNEIVAILGYNGSGKSTMCKLMMGMLTPQKGKMKLNGKELSDYSKEDVLALYGVAYQDFNKYQLSVRDNIGFGYVEKYQEENVRKAFQEAGCQTLHAKLSEGLETNLGKKFYEDGIDLSGGEWQKLALARAYMGQHEILILDEPTASIDPIKEMEMLKDFREILKGRTAVLISHRIGFARLADRIMMMQDGVLVESGSHEELIEKNGVYAKFFAAQKELYI